MIHWIIFRYIKCGLSRQLVSCIETFVLMICVSDNGGSCHSITHLCLLPVQSQSWVGSIIVSRSDYLVLRKYKTSLQVFISCRNLVGLLYSLVWTLSNRWLSWLKVQPSLGCSYQIWLLQNNVLTPNAWLMIFLPWQN